MESDNIKQRTYAIESFIKNQKDDYLTMLYRTKKRLGLALGFSSRVTTIGEGMMNEVFSDLIAGTRKWDMEKFKLEQVLWMNLKVKFLQELKRKRFVPTMVISEADENDGKCVDDLINTKPDDVEGSVDAETIQAYCFDTILKGDDDAQVVFDEMLKGKTQKQIAEYLHTTPDKAEIKIRSIRRKISREIPRYMLENLPKSLITKILNQS